MCRTKEWKHHGVVEALQCQPLRGRVEVLKCKTGRISYIDQSGVHCDMHRNSDIKQQRHITQGKINIQKKKADLSSSIESQTKNKCFKARFKSSQCGGQMNMQWNNVPHSTVHLRRTLHTLRRAPQTNRGLRMSDS